jgi:hypothetical protein
MLVPVQAFARQVPAREQVDPHLQVPFGRVEAMRIGQVWNRRKRTMSTCRFRYKLTY